MAVEYVCADCGKLTIIYPLFTPPKGRLCLICSFLRTYPVLERAALRARLQASIKDITQD